MNEKNIDLLFKSTRVGDLFYVKEISLLKYHLNIPDSILPFNFTLAFVTRIDKEKISLYTHENNIVEFSREDLLEFNLLEKL